MTIHAHLSYLQKHSFRPPLIIEPPHPDLAVIVVIPCHAEPDLIRTLNSLEQCRLPDCAVEVIVHINAGIHASEEIHARNHQTFEEMRSWSAVKRQLSYHAILSNDLPRKHAGVGMARKIGMDEAVHRFELAGKEDGIILCLDADSLVEADYLTEVFRHFREHPKTDACMIRFEHPLDGEAFSEEIYAGIIRYELWLRYYVEALRFAGHPYAYHTIGSSMAVRNSAYQAQGGMNRRKAGEDFYFLQKYIELGKATELNNCKVIPSPRESDKVPFGTGKAIGDWLSGAMKIYPAYDPQTFIDLKVFLDQVPDYYSTEEISVPDSIADFLEREAFGEKLTEIRRHVSGKHNFVKRFFRWFNGLKVLKYVHFARDYYYPDIAVVAAASALYRLRFQEEKTLDTKEWLLLYRELQSGN